MGANPLFTIVDKIYSATYIFFSSSRRASVYMRTSAAHFFCILETA